jgi:GNAT superfamily N-acetyltransferase
MADKQIVIRLATVEDAERVAALSTQLGYPTSPEETGRYLAHIEQEPAHVFYVAAQDGWVVGWIHVRVRALVQVGRAGEIEGLVVDEAYRGRGIGRLLMQQSEQWMRERSCGSVYVRSNITRDEAHRFYEGLGYEHTKTSLTFRKMLSDDS